MARRRKETKAEEDTVIENAAGSSHEPQRKRPLRKAAADVKYKQDLKEDEEDSEEEKIQPQRKRRGRKAADAPEVKPELKEEEEDSDEEKIQPQRKRPGHKAADAPEVKPELKEEEEDSEEEKIQPQKSAPRIVKCIGPVPVFDCCKVKETARVHAMGDSIYSIMLNKTDIGNNNNKFYGLQVLQLQSNNYGCFIWWGRVGYAGNNTLHTFPTPAAAITMFCKKFVEKTGLHWDERSEDPVPGKYRVIEIDQFQDVDKENEGGDQDADKKPNEIPDSVLAAEIQEVIKLITNLSMLAQGIRSIELSYENSEKMPLGKLTATQLERGYQNLLQIENLLKATKRNQQALTQATNEFYSNIPHSLGMSRPKVIDSMDEVKAKSDLLDTLKEVQIAIKTIKEGESGIKEEQNPIDRMYYSLNCHLAVVQPKSAQFKMIQEYMDKTHATTHMFKTKINTVFEIARRDETDRFIDYGNKMLLWHGSRLTNFCGILSHGLRIAPPEAPCTGYMFGKGIYFADASSKSANYCYPKDKEQGLLILAEVSLGSMNVKKAADYDAHQLPEGKHSTFGMGQWAPKAAKKGFKKIFGDVVVPVAPLEQVKEASDCCLLYNEYIVYNEAQVRLRFLVQTEFIDDI